MNHKMVINTYLPKIESKKHTKQRKRDRIMDMDSILMVARWKGDLGNKEMRVLRSTSHGWCGSVD